MCHEDVGFNKDHMEFWEVPKKINGLFNRKKFKHSVTHLGLISAAFSSPTHPFIN